MNTKRNLIIIICLLALVAFIIIASILYLRFSFGYKPESLADFCHAIKNNPDCDYIQQGIEYQELENGIVLRTDKIRINDRYNTLCESYGIPSKAGIYYTSLHEKGTQIHKRESTRYKYDDDGNQVGKIVIETEVYYLFIDGYHLIYVSSNQPGVTDSANTPTITIQRGEKYITYLSPADLSGDYQIVCNGSIITGLQVLESANKTGD